MLLDKALRIFLHYQPWFLHYSYGFIFIILLHIGLLLHPGLLQACCIDNMYNTITVLYLACLPDPDNVQLNKEAKNEAHFELQKKAEDPTTRHVYGGVCEWDSHTQTHTCYFLLCGDT